MSTVTESTNAFLSAINTAELRTPIRPLSGIEITMSCMHGLMRGTAQATQVLEISGHQSFEAYLQASDDLLVEFPILRACIEESGGDIWFFSGTQHFTIPVTCESVADGMAAEMIIRALVDDPLLQEHSLWRIVVLNVVSSEKTKIIMTFHHAILDGHGLSVVAARFLYYLDRYQSGEIAEIMVRKFPPPINDSLTEKSVKVKPSNVSTLPYYVEAPLNERRTAWKSIQIDRGLRASLEKRAKEDKLLYNSILSAVLIKSISDARLYAEPIEFKSAVSLRIFDNMENRDESNLGCYMGISSTHHVAQSKGIAEIAKDYEVSLFRDTLQRVVAKNQYSYKDISNSIVKSLESNSFAGGIGITNIGDIAIPQEYKNFELLGYFTTVSRIGGTYALVLHRYSFNQVDTIQFVYPKPLTSEIVIDELIGSFRKHLICYSQRKRALQVTTPGNLCESI